MGAGCNFGSDRIEMELHGFAVAHWQHQGSADTTLRAYRAEQIGRLRSLIICGTRT
jgi:hypothetical protein